MDLSNKPPLMRVLCAEPLEGRWLLSGAPPSSSATTPAIVVTVLEPFEEEDEEEETDQIIAEADLPAEVLAEFKAQFVNAQIKEVEREDEEEGLQYGIDAIKADGQRVDVTFSPEGQILDTEVFLDLDEVPQAVADRARAETGGTITEVSTSGNNEYEVQTTRDDGTEFEGLLSWQQPEQPTASPEEPTAQPNTPAVPAPITFADASTTVASPPAGDGTFGAIPSESAEAQQVAQADSAAKSDAEAKAREDAIKKNAAAKVAAAATTLPADQTLRALEALAAGVGANIWLPEVAGALVNVLPINLDGIEKSMQDVLQQVGTLGGKVNGESALASGATRLAMTATLVAAVKVLLNQSKRAKSTRPALVFGPGAASSWGWVLGTTDARRRRHVPSRLREP